MDSLQITDEIELRGLAQKLLQMASASRIKDSASVIALHGDLGAGKTAFVKALASELGITEVVTSPTFVIMKLYDAEYEDSFSQLVHIDAYRIEDIDEMRVLRFEEILGQKDTIICIEWAEKLEKLLPSHTIHMNIALQGEKRLVTIS